MTGMRTMMLGMTQYLSEQKDDDDDRDEDDDAGDDTHLDGLWVEGHNIGEFCVGIAHIRIVHSVPKHSVMI